MFISVPSQPPTAFKLTATSSTSITASWQLPPVFARHGRTITGFKLFYKKKGFGGSATTLAISRGSILSENVTGLDKYTEYEFQVLAFTSDGDGPKSSVVVERTMEDGMWEIDNLIAVFIVCWTVCSSRIQSHAVTFEWINVDFLKKLKTYSSDVEVASRELKSAILEIFTNN